MQFNNLLQTLFSVTVVCSILPTVAKADIRRDITPIVAGTKLEFPTSNCTAGLVVKRTGAFNNFTEYRRALRFVVTSGHCGNVNDTVKVGGRSVGKMIWKSNINDLSLVQIEPNYRHLRYCSAPSTGLTCSIVNRYDPIALGKVILPSLRTRSITAVPVIGTGSPANNEVFCTSGKTTGVICTWGKVQVPGWMQTRSKSAESFGPNIQAGDSGGPVVSHSGTVYGIIESQGDARSNYPNHMIYVPISNFFAEQPGYELAPSQ